MTFVYAKMDYALSMYQMSKRIYGRVGDKIRNSFLIKACFLA